MKLLTRYDAIRFVNGMSSRCQSSAWLVERCATCNLLESGGGGGGGKAGGRSSRAGGGGGGGGKKEGGGGGGG